MAIPARPRNFVLNYVAEGEERTLIVYQMLYTYISYPSNPVVKAHSSEDLSARCFTIFHPLEAFPLPCNITLSSFLGGYVLGSKLGQVGKGPKAVVLAKGMRTC